MDNSDQTRHLGVHHMTATKCEKKKKRESKCCIPFDICLTQLTCISQRCQDGYSVTKSKPSLSYMSAEALAHWLVTKMIVLMGISGRGFLGLSQRWHILLIWFVVGAQCRFITRRWWWRWKSVVFTYQSTMSAKVQKRACERVEMCVQDSEIAIWYRHHPEGLGR